MSHNSSTETTTLLTARQTTHGSFSDNARYAQLLKSIFHGSRDWYVMPEVQKEALDMMACKLARILSGQATFDDHWADIAGYATLAREACFK